MVAAFKETRNTSNASSNYLVKGSGGEEGEKVYGIFIKIIKIIFVVSALITLTMLLVPAAVADLKFCSILRNGKEVIIESTMKSQKILGNIPIQSDPLVSDKRVIGNYIVAGMYLAGLAAAGIYCIWKRTCQGSMIYIYVAHIIAAVSCLLMLGIYGPVCNNLRWVIPSHDKGDLSSANEIGIILTTVACSISIFFGVMSMMYLQVKSQIKSN